MVLSHPVDCADAPLKLNLSDFKQRFFPCLRLFTDLHIFFYTYSLTLSLVRARTLSFSLALFLAHKHTHTHSHTLTLTHTHTHTNTHTHTHTHTHTYTHTLLVGAGGAFDLASLSASVANGAAASTEGEAGRWSVPPPLSIGDSLNAPVTKGKKGREREGGGIQSGEDP